MIMFILGIIVGLLISILLLLLLNKYHIPIHRNIQKVLANPHISGDTRGYIIGLSEEEQSFRDSLNIDHKDTKLT